MHRRPRKNSAEDFINRAPELSQSQEAHTLLQHIKWPLLTYSAPSMAEGSTLLKPISIALKEFEWNSIDKHTKILGVTKAEWIRSAIFKLMSEEQAYLTSKNNEK